MATNLGKIGEPIFIQHAGIPKWIKYHNSNLKLLNGNNLMKFGPVYGNGDYEVTDCNFWHIPPNISEAAKPIFTKF